MIKAVLLDLDDTLLGNPTESFVRNYLSLLNRTLGPALGLPDLIQPLILATRAVVNDLDPLRRNVDVFYGALMPPLPVTRAQFAAAVNDFYRTAYPRLQAHTTLRPAARPLADSLVAGGYAVVVATNPFFPRAAIEQRLAWAGLPVGEVPFALVTTLENMRFTKPHPHYYEETLAHVGVRPDQALMVGDDWENDIVPARQAGLNTYWVCGEGMLRSAEHPPSLDGCGTLDDLAACVQAGWLGRLEARPLEPAQIAPRLAGTLAALLETAQDVPPHAWTVRPTPGVWSPQEIVCHAWDAERGVWQTWLKAVLRGDNPTLLPPAQTPPACGEESRELLLAFAAERRATLDLLAQVDGPAWRLPAQHPTRGPITLLDLADSLAQQDREQIALLRRALQPGG